MVNRQYPVNIGGGLHKQGIGAISKNGGFDVFIIDEDMTHQYIQLHFCSRERLNNFIQLLCDVEKLWDHEKEQEQ